LLVATNASQWATLAQVPPQARHRAQQQHTRAKPQQPRHGLELGAVKHKVAVTLDQKTFHLLVGFTLAQQAAHLAAQVIGQLGP
jgi:hypothetical protein